MPKNDFFKSERSQSTNSFKREFYSDEDEKLIDTEKQKIQNRKTIIEQFLDMSVRNDQITEITGMLVHQNLLSTVEDNPINTHVPKVTEEVMCKLGSEISVKCMTPHKYNNKESRTKQMPNKNHNKSPGIHKSSGRKHYQRNECKDCNVVFKRNSLLSRHILDFHCTRGFYCKICGNKYDLLLTLKRHVIAFHMVNREYSNFNGRPNISVSMENKTFQKSVTSFV